MSRPNVTDDIVDGLSFARDCVLDQRAASHDRKDHSWDHRYAAALEAIAVIRAAHILAAHKQSAKKAKKSS